jgi:hypothetical protein
MILVYYPFLDVCEGVRAVSVCRHVEALDPVQMGVVWGGQSQKWKRFPAPSSSNMGTLWAWRQQLQPHRAD